MLPPSSVIASATKAIPHARVLMAAAEAVFQAPKAGSAKKAWVVAQLIALADHFDIPLLKEDIEHKFKVDAIEAIVELVWSLFFKGK